MPLVVANQEGSSMVFRIQPHNRLQEWVAEEKSYFEDEGLEYAFQTGDNVVRHYPYQGAAERNGPSIQSTEAAPPEVKRGAFESLEAGRTCDISAACHWAVSMAASGAHGNMWEHAYSVTSSGIYVAPESKIRKAEDLSCEPNAREVYERTHRWMRRLEIFG